MGKGGKKVIRKKTHRFRGLAHPSVGVREATTKKVRVQLSMTRRYSKMRIGKRENAAESRGPFGNRSRAATSENDVQS